MTDPDTWTPEQWADLQVSLDQLAEDDPDVAEAARRLDSYAESVAYRARVGVPRARFPRRTTP